MLDCFELMNKYEFMAENYDRIESLDDISGINRDKISNILSNLIPPRSEQSVIDHYNEILYNKHPAIILDLEVEYAYLILLIIRDLDYNIFSFLFCLYLKTINNVQSRFSIGYLFSSDIQNIFNSDMSFVTNHPINFVSVDSIPDMIDAEISTLRSIKHPSMFKMYDIRDNILVETWSYLVECQANYRYLIDSSSVSKKFRKYVHPSLYIHSKIRPSSYCYKFETDKIETSDNILETARQDLLHLMRYILADRKLDNAQIRYYLPYINSISSSGGILSNISLDVSKHWIINIRPKNEITNNDKEYQLDIQLAFEIPDINLVSLVYDC